MENEINPVLETHGLSKRFLATQALDSVSMQVMPQTIHAVVGENGAGKSTLMKIVGGVHQPDSGEIFVAGKKVRIPTPNEADQLGIGFVHQEISLCEDLTVAENIFMSAINEQPEFIVPFSEYKRRAAKLLHQFDAGIRPDAIVADLSLSQKQVVEIARALSRESKLIIFDEPTAALTETEAGALFETIHKLRGQGISILYISHRMVEVFDHCDVVTVLRDGKHIETLPVSETSEDDIVSKMVGRKIGTLYPQKAGPPDEENDEVLLEVSGLSSGTDFQDVSFRLYKGEILGFAGLIGAGRTELAQTICGLQSRTAGKMKLRGQELEILNYRDAVRYGITYLTENRKERGLFLQKSVKQNISALNLDAVAPRGIIRERVERQLAEEYGKKLNIRFASIEQVMKDLSGGNQQKALIAKLLATHPKVLIVDEPTRGVDVGAKSEIHALLRQWADAGVGVIMISSELPEVLGMCDRVMVMHEGRAQGVVSGSDIEEERIVRMASGL